MNNEIDNVQQDKLYKLKKMRFIATSLLIFMALIYLVFRRYETYNIFFSSITAFAQAGMIGALADWFAVTALFKHPLGMSWIPHTAIIRKNRDRIGESLASFVVTNFFTEEIIRKKLESINFSEVISSYIKDKKYELSEKTVNYIPVISASVLNRKELTDSIISELRSVLGKVEPYPLIKVIIPALVSSGGYVSAVKQLLFNIYRWVHVNREETLRIIEGIDKKLGFPFVGNAILRFIDRTLLKLIEDIESGNPTEFNREILYSLPERLLKEFENSEEIKEKVEKIKNDILNSEQFDRFTNEKAEEIKAFILNYDYKSNSELQDAIVKAFDFIADELLSAEPVRKSTDGFIKESISTVVCMYRQDLGRLISDTVKNWPLDDMAEKLEVQIGGDLQYIRINGTIIGGIAGLIIHIFSYILK